MEHLLKSEISNRQPLRKFEPVIRFDIDGTPQPRRPLIQFTKQNETVNLEVSSAKNDMKRKAEDESTIIVPKKKIQKQSTITKFFGKD